MKRPLLVILLGILVVVAVIFATRKPPTPAEISDADEPIEAVSAEVLAAKTELRERELPGEEPAVAPVFHCVVSPQPPPSKTIYLAVSEEHGYYAETLQVRLWKKSTPENVLTLYFNKYVPANESVELKATLVDEDMGYVAGGSLGAPEDWDYQVLARRVREKNPQPLPPQPQG